MSFISRLNTPVKALKEIGPKSLGLYAWYRFCLISGYLKWRTPVGIDNEIHRDHAHSFVNQLISLISLPNRGELDSLLGKEIHTSLLNEAAEIINGYVCLFGDDPVPLELCPSTPVVHWTAYERGKVTCGVEDIKYLWEPARFGWVFTLCRAYHLTLDEKYSEAFWQYLERFLQCNPPNLGPNWISAQEVSLRIIAFVFAAQVLSTSENTTEARLLQLANAIANHAARIPHTMAYSKAQNNNHLLSEALGLYTASLALPEHPSASRWRELGWRSINWAFQNQITTDGTYIQHSTNYHRFMLQIALWANKLTESEGKRFPKKTRENLAAATRWLLVLLDSKSGMVPNLGSNDGSYILPLSSCPFNDYRPVLQAAASSFLGARVLETGPWDEMSLWFGRTQKSKLIHKLKESCSTNYSILSNPSSDSWAYFRTPKFTSRPGHADLLHLDLWWRGINVALDAGTNQYNAPIPWDNTLTHAQVHNTITVDGQDQMTRAGRFLYLDWAQVEVISKNTARENAMQYISAQYKGFNQLSFIHNRQVETYPDGRWMIVDKINYGESIHHGGIHKIRLQWLLPDWIWEINDTIEDSIELRIKAPYGWIRLQVNVVIEGNNTVSNPKSALVRAGEIIHGFLPISPTQGWVSPTYGKIDPALALIIEVEKILPVTLLSEWHFPKI